MEKILKYSLMLVSLIASIGGFIYKIYALNNFGIFLSIIIISVIFTIVAISDAKVNFRKDKKTINFKSTNLLLILFYLLFISAALIILIKNATADPIISPWTKIPGYFFIFYLAATITLIINIAKNNRFSVFLLSVHYFISLAVAVIIYKIGYGFDQHIHKAAIDRIIEFGAIEPKTLYYSGYYSLVIILHKIFFFPIDILNKLLVPAMASIFLPAVISISLKKFLDDEKKINFLILSLSVVPFGIFILSTPQNLAYLFLLLSVILSACCKNNFDLTLLFLLSLSALMIHPIAGIPAIVLSAYFIIFNINNEKIKKYLYSGLFLTSSFALPALFLILNKNNLYFNKETIKNLLNLNFLKIIVPSQENIWLNTAYLFGFNKEKIIFCLIALGVFFAWKRKAKYFLIYALMIVSSLISYLFIVLQPFTFLIDYERSDYANRMIVVAAIFSVPFLLVSFYKILAKINAQNKTTKIIITIAFSLLVSINLYCSYPRLDNYYNSHGISTGKNDILAAQWIDNDARGDYIVLANQQMSAAALNKFGFKKYYSDGKESLFYYSIPTGGILYQQYLKMIYEKPSKENAKKAMDIVDAETTYFVLNKYWWAYSKVLEEAKNEADMYENINNEVHIFKYKKSF